MARPHKTTNFTPSWKKWGYSKRPHETTTPKCEINDKKKEHKKQQKEGFKENNLTKSNIVFTKMHNLTEEIHTDQTEWFSIRLSANNQYMCIYYEYDINSILVKAIPTRKIESLVEVEKYFVEELEKRGSKPKFQRLDNKILQTVQKLYVTK